MISAAPASRGRQSTVLSVRQRVAAGAGRYTHRADAARDGADAGGHGRADTSTRTRATTTQPDRVHTEPGSGTGQPGQTAQHCRGRDLRCQARWRLV